MRLWCNICYDKEAPEGGSAHWEAGPCGHIYHSSCLSAWRVQAGDRKKSRYLKCPTCKIHVAKPIRLYPSEGPPSSVPDIPEAEEEEQEDVDEEPMTDAQMARELREIAGEKRRLAEQVKELKARHDAEIATLREKYNRKQADYATVAQQRDDILRQAQTRDQTRDAYIDKLERKEKEHKRRQDELTKQIASETLRANKAEQERDHHINDVANGLEEAQNARDRLQSEKDRLKKKADTLASANENYRLKYEAKSAEMKKLRAQLHQLQSDSQNQFVPSSSRKRQREDDQPLHPTPRSSQQRQSSMAPPPTRSLGYTVTDRRATTSKSAIDNSLFMDEDDAPIPNVGQDWEPQSEEDEEEASFMYKEESFKARDPVKVPLNAKLGLPSSFMKSKTLDLGPKIRPKLKVFK